MTSIIEFLQANPLYIVVLAFLILFLLVSLFKKAVKLIVAAVVLNIAYGFYLHDISAAYEQANEKLESVVETTKDVLDR